MAVLAAGDKTTQFRLWLDANAAGSDIMPKMAAALATAIPMPATTDTVVLVATYVAQD